MNPTPETQIPNGWESRSLASLGTYTNGFAFSDKYWSEHGLPIVRIAQITGSQGVVDRYPGRLSDSYLLADGDLIFSWSGTLTVVKWVGGPAWLNQHLFKVEASSDIDSSFLFHVLRSAAGEMDKRSHGSTMKHIKRGELREFSVNIPAELSEQARIAFVLDTIDEATAKTEAVIAKLKQLRAGMLHDLLNYGLDENGQLRDPISHPEQFKDSPLGLIPREWDVRQLSQLVSGLESGVSVDSFDLPSSKEMVGVLKTSCVTSGIFNPQENKIVKSKEIYRVRCNPTADSIIISRMNTPQLVGESAYVGQSITNLFLPDRLWQTFKHTNDPTCIRWLSYVMQEKEFRNIVSSGATGTSGSMKNISQTFFLGIEARVPDKPEQERIAAYALKFDSLLDAEIACLAKFKSLKSGLQDDLLTGRVPVPETIREGAAGA